MRAASQVKWSHRRHPGVPDGGGDRQERFDVEHFITPHPDRGHRLVAMGLAVRIGRFLREHPLATLYAGPVEVELSELEVVEPDLALVVAQRRGVVTGGIVRGVPDLVVEVVSEHGRRRSEGGRRQLYARFGVGEYWVVDPELETVRVLKPGADGALAGPLLSREAGDRLTTGLLPGLEIPLADLFG